MSKIPPITPKEAIRAALQHILEKYEFCHEYSDDPNALYKLCEEADAMVQKHASRMKRKAKLGCPYYHHAADCDCQGAGGDR